jgi:glutathione S-transferase
MTSIILHHYDASPVSELVRLALGFKGLAWGSVIIPTIAPKPDLEPLTGGYRKTPVLQMGADIFCDSARICDALEAVAPSPSLYPAPLGPLARIIGQWTGAQMFRAAAATALAPVAETIPDVFWADRKALFGMDKGPFVAAAPHLTGQWQAGMQWLAMTLADGRPYLGGDAPGYADLAAYMDIWFATRTGNPAATSLVAEHAALAAWAGRVAGFGHGAKQDMTGAQALDAALAATPALPSIVEPGCPFAAGSQVAVLSEDPGATPVVGHLDRWTATDVAVRRSHARVGEVVVHFPRIGMVVRAV